MNSVKQENHSSHPVVMPAGPLRTTLVAEWLPFWLEVIFNGRESSGLSQPKVRSKN